MPFLYPNQNQQEENNKKQKPLIIFGTASFGTGTSQAKFSSPDLANPVLDLLRTLHIDTFEVDVPEPRMRRQSGGRSAEWAERFTQTTSPPGTGESERKAPA